MEGPAAHEQAITQSCAQRHGVTGTTCMQRMSVQLYLPADWLIGRPYSHDGIITAPPPISTSPPAEDTGARMAVGMEEAFGEAGFCRQ